MTQPSIEGVGHGVPRMLYASDGSNWYAVLVDSDGHVKIDVVTAALPTDAATQTTLASCLTALQLIDDLRAALGSVNTDDLQVDVKTYPGSNALGNIPFGYEAIVSNVINSTIVGANGYIASSAAPAGYIWVITNVIAWNDSHTSTCVYFALNYDGTDCEFYSLLATIAVSQRVPWSGHIYLDAGDSIRAYFTGASNGDTARIRISGYRMKIA